MMVVSNEWRDVSDEEHQSATDVVVAFVLSGKTDEIPADILITFKLGEYADGLGYDRRLQPEYEEGILWDEAVPYPENLIEYEDYFHEFVHMAFEFNRMKAVIRAGKCKKIEWRQFVDAWLDYEVERYGDGEAYRAFTGLILTRVQSSSGGSCLYMHVLDSDLSQDWDSVRDGFIEFFITVEDALSFARTRGIICSDVTDYEVRQLFLDRVIKKQGSSLTS